MTAIILAAGRSKRMAADVPKVLLQAAGRPLLAWLLDAVKAAGIERTVVVVGSLREMVRAELAGRGVEFAVQEQQLGTADAVLACRGLLAEDEECVVLVGDAPLVRPETLGRLVADYRQAQADVAVLTARLADPAGYGRIIRAGDGTVAMIIEERDASDDVRRIREVNSGMYAFRWGRLEPALGRIRPSPVSNEYYLTDAVREVADEGGRVIPVVVDDPNEILGANTPEQLGEIAAQLERRVRQPVE